MSKKTIALLMIIAIGGHAAADDTDLGNLSANPFDPNSTSNPFGAGNPYDPNSVNNPYGQYGNPYSNKSVTNPYATDTPKLYDSQGNYRGKLSSNPHDPDSVSNPYGRYGNRFSPDSINNPFGAGNPYAPDSPTNPYGNGWSIVDDDDDDGLDDFGFNNYGVPEPPAEPSTGWEDYLQEDTDSLFNQDSLFENNDFGLDSDYSTDDGYDFDVDYSTGWDDE